MRRSTSNLQTCEFFNTVVIHSRSSKSSIQYGCRFWNGKTVDMTSLSKYGETFLFSNRISTNSSLRNKLRLSLIWACNFKCIYCRPGGDGGTTPFVRMDSDRALFIAKVFEKIGSQKVNLTGGEPFLHSGLPKITSGLIQSTDLKIAINTNGSANISMVDEIPFNSRLNFVVSLDSLCDKTLRNLGRFSKSAKILKFLDRLKHHGFRVRINSVICAGENCNINEISSLIEFCESEGFELKIQSVFNTSKDSFSNTQKLYVELGFIKSFIREKGYEYLDTVNAGNGVTELRFRKPGGITIRILDKKPANTTYGAICIKCPQFPCDTGLYAFYVNENEKLMVCRNRREECFDLAQFSSISRASAHLARFLDNKGF